MRERLLFEHTAGRRLCVAAYADLAGAGELAPYKLKVHIAGSPRLSGEEVTVLVSRFCGELVGIDPHGVGHGSEICQLAVESLLISHKCGVAVKVNGFAYGSVALVSNADHLFEGHGVILCGVGKGLRYGVVNIKGVVGEQALFEIDRRIGRKCGKRKCRDHEDGKRDSKCFFHFVVLPFALFMIWLMRTVIRD